MKAVFDKNKEHLLAILNEKDSGYKSKIKNYKQQHKDVVIEDVTGFPYFTLHNETQWPNSPICFSGSNKEELKEFMKDFIANNPKVIDKDASCDVFTLVWHHEPWRSGQDTECVGHIHMMSFSFAQDLSYYDSTIDDINEKKSYITKG